MDNNELLHAIGENKELAGKVIQLWKAGAPAEEFAAVLAEAGLSAELDQIEEVLAEAQEKHAKKIAIEKLDDAEMDKVTGGNIACDNQAFCITSWACITAWNNCWLEDQCASNFKCSSNAGCSLPTTLRG